MKSTKAESMKVDAKESMMTSTQPVSKRSAPSTHKEPSGIKLLIMVASLAATFGGWGILALGEQQSTASAQAPTVVVQPAEASLPPVDVYQPRSSGTLRQVSAPPAPAQSRIITRTRSSR